MVVARLALAIAAGALLYLSFPPRSLWWLAPLCFAGLGLVLHGRRARAGLGYGFVFGLTFYLLHLVWIEDFLGTSFGSAPWLALSGLMALFAALACAAATVVAKLPGGPAWMAALYVGQEALRTAVPLNGFPWGRVAFSQPEGVYTSLASIGGAPLVSFAVVLTGFGLARLLVSLARVVRDRKRTPPPLRPMVRAAAFAAIPLLAGAALWPNVGTAATAGTTTVALVQGNAPNIGLDLLDARSEIRRNHFAESERLASRVAAGELPRPDLVVWPETATEVTGADDEIDAMVAGFGVPALIGALNVRDDGRAENSVIAWHPEQGRQGHYVKQELVPFAEYVPWRPIARWFTPFLDSTADMLAGTRPSVLEVNGVTVGVAICYEAAYDYVAREAVRSGAELLVVPTNNAWYGPGEMSHQQLAMSRVRAVEHGRAAVVPATSGVSAIVRPDGSLVRSTELFTADSLVATVPLRTTTTVATTVGAWPERIIIGAGLVALLLRIGWRIRGRVTRSRQAGGGG